MKRLNYNRPGITAVLAMLYMALFATLALGFYASVTTSVQVAGNEQRQIKAIRACESGMAFMKYQLANLGIPGGTQADQLFYQAYQKLATHLNGYPLMGGATLVPSSTDDTIYIPSATGWVNSDSNGSGFRAVLTKQQGGQQIRCKILGKFGGTLSSKAVQLDYSVAKDASKIFNYGVASKSAISLSGSVVVQGATDAAMGSIMSATLSNSTPLTMSGNASISGDASFVQANPSLSIGSNSQIAGYKPTDPAFFNHIHKDIGDVPFPLCDTSSFMPFAPAKGTTGPQVIVDKNPTPTYFKNIRIKAGTNPSFQANTTLEGVVVIESPNQVKFQGQVNITGVIVSETLDTVNDANNASFDLSKNTINFSGGVTYRPVSALPDTVDFPASLRAMGGTMVLAPGFAATYGGNFGTIAGSIIASQLTFNGTAGGIITGSAVNLRDSSCGIGGTNTITIQSVGTSNYPAGVFFGSHYAPLPHTYAEVASGN